MKDMMVEDIPGQLKGEDIPYFARISAIADAFDAMTSKRTYRDSLDIGIVRSEIEKNLGTQFDPELGKLFLEIIDNEYDKIQEIQNKYLS